MKRDLAFEVIYPHPPQRVWRALTDPALIARWLMQNDFAPTVGHKFRFRMPPQPGFDGIVHCEVLEADPPRRLAYSWRGGPIDTHVQYTLEPLEGGTRLRLEHTGFAGPKGVLLSFMLGSGWKSKILKKRLPEVLAGLASDSGEPVDGPADCHVSVASKALGRVVSWLPKGG
jgi:uncharacterized protein YndB with AHSA1/START domain